MALHKWPAIDLAVSIDDYKHVFRLVIVRAVYPASEPAAGKCLPVWQRQTAIGDNAAKCDITGYIRNPLTRDKLYQSVLALYNHKEAIERHLFTKTNELFDLQDRIMLYDLTNTHFEGSQRNGSLPSGIAGLLDSQHHSLSTKASRYK